MFSSIQSLRSSSKINTFFLSYSTSHYLSKQKLQISQGQRGSPYMQFSANFLIIGGRGRRGEHYDWCVMAQTRLHVATRWIVICVFCAYFIGNSSRVIFCWSAENNIWLNRIWCQESTTAGAKDRECCGMFKNTWLDHFAGDEILWYLIECKGTLLLFTSAHWGFGSCLLSDRCPTRSSSISSSPVRYHSGISGAHICETFSLGKKISSRFTRALQLSASSHDPPRMWTDGEHHAATSCGCSGVTNWHSATFSSSPLPWTNTERFAFPHAGTFTWTLLRRITSVWALMRAVSSQPPPRLGRDLEGHAEWLPLSASPLWG